MRRIRLRRKFGRWGSVNQLLTIRDPLRRKKPHPYPADVQPDTAPTAQKLPIGIAVRKLRGVGEQHHDREKNAGQVHLMVTC